MLRFGAFEINTNEGELRKKGVKLRLQGQPLQLLALLAERSGKLVTREELRATLWAENTFVDFDHSLNNCIARIREVLDDSADSPRFIETVPRRGYRFVSPVEDVSERLAPAAVGRATASELADGAARQRHRLWQRRRVVLITMACMVIVVAAFTAAYFWLHRSPVAAIDSIAVLPFENLSGDPGENYFVDGMTDELITTLAKIRSLRVISRSSVMLYKGTNKPLQEIARELNVNGVVEGAIMRSGNRVRITAQLIYGPADQHLWAETYERDLGDVLKLQGDVAQAIAQQIRVEVSPQLRAQLQSAPSVNPEAYEAYLKGSFYNNKWTKEGFEKGIEYFNRALEKDPHNARAYAELAVAYGGLGIYGDVKAYPKQKAASLKALEIDDTLADAHTTLAWAKFTLDWDIAGAEQEFRRAIELNPSDARAHAWYGTFLAMRGRVEDSFRQVRKARELDPLSLSNVSTAAFIAYYNARDYDKAIQVCHEALDLDPSFRPAYWRLVRVYEQTGELSKALEEQQRVAALIGEDPRVARETDLLREAYLKKGARGYWVQKMELLRPDANPRDLINMAKIYERLGNKDEAFRWLDMAFKNHVPYLIGDVPANPDLDGLRSDPRFSDLLRRLVPRSE